MTHVNTPSSDIPITIRDLDCPEVERFCPAPRKIQCFKHFIPAMTHVCDHILTSPERRLWHALSIIVAPDLAEHAWWSDDQKAFELARKFWQQRPEVYPVMQELYDFYMATAQSTLDHAIHAKTYCLDRKLKNAHAHEDTQGAVPEIYAFYSPLLLKLSLSLTRAHSIYFANARGIGVSSSIFSGKRFDEIYRERSSNPLPRVMRKHERKPHKSSGRRKPSPSRDRDQGHHRAARSRVVAPISNEHEALEALYQHYKKRVGSVRSHLNRQLYHVNTHTEIPLRDDLSYEDWVNAASPQLDALRDMT